MVAAEPLGKAEWIAAFLVRAERSLLATAERLGERDEIAVILAVRRSLARFDLLSSPEVSAYFNQAGIPGWTHPLRLRDLLHHDSGLLSISAHRCAIMTRPHPIFVRVLQNMKAGSLGKDSSRCNPLPVGHPFYPQHAGEIGAALDLLQEHCPSYYALVNTFLHRLVLVDDASSFRGATS